MRDQTRGTVDFCVLCPEQLPVLSSSGTGQNSAPPEAGASPGYGCWHCGSPVLPTLGIWNGSCCIGTLRVCSNPSSWLLSQDADAHQPPCSQWAFCSEPVSNGMEHSPASFGSLDHPALPAFPHRFLRSEQFP